MAAQKQDDQHERTFSSYVRIQVVVLKTCLGRWTIGRSGERGSGISVLPARYDADDDLSSINLSSIVFVFSIFVNFLNLSLSIHTSVSFYIFFYIREKFPSAAKSSVYRKSYIITLLFSISLLYLATLLYNILLLYSIYIYIYIYIEREREREREREKKWGTVSSIHIYVHPWNIFIKVKLLLRHI